MINVGGGPTSSARDLLGVDRAAARRILAAPPMLGTISGSRRLGSGIIRTRAISGSRRGGVGGNAIHAPRTLRKHIAQTVPKPPIALRQRNLMRLPLGGRRQRN